MINVLLPTRCSARDLHQLLSHCIDIWPESLDLPMQRNDVTLGPRLQWTPFVNSKDVNSPKKFPAISPTPRSSATSLIHFDLFVLDTVGSFINSARSGLFFAASRT